MLIVRAPAPPPLYTLTLHDALPILALDALPSARGAVVIAVLPAATAVFAVLRAGERPSPDGEHRGRGGQHGDDDGAARRSEEHTSELQSRLHLVCRLLPEKKKTDT